MAIFISHSHGDKELTERVKPFIEGTGAKVHLYTHDIDPTKTIIEKIKESIRGAIWELSFGQKIVGVANGYYKKSVP